MQIEINNTHQSSGLSKVCDFKIETNGIMIKALTSRLYSDPVRSILRELASNALDACPSTPMTIHFPTTLEPFFSVRDHGPGLSESSMVEVFTHFGASTKRSTNSQIGGFGLGAKSPFALVNSYTIKSYHEGSLSTYIASLGQDGMPSLHRISSTPTNETGLEVIVPSSPSLAHKWTAAATQLQFFRPAPIFNLSVEMPHIVYENPDYLILRSGCPSILIGPVAYPLDADKCRLSNYPVVLKFPIGTIEVTASREDIVYNFSTITAITNKYKDVYSNYKSRVQTLLPACDSILDVWRLLDGVPFYDTKWKTYTVDSDSIYLPTIQDPSNSSIDLPNYGRISKYTQRNRKIWKPDWSTVSKLTSNTKVFKLDDSRKWQDRIKLHFDSIPHSSGTCDILLVKDCTHLDAIKYPYIPISALPTLTPLRAPAKRRSGFKTISRTDRVVFPPASVTYTHYAKTVPYSDSYVALAEFPSTKLTESIYRAICKRLNIDGFYLIPSDNLSIPSTLTDVMPLWTANLAIIKPLLQQNSLASSYKFLFYNRSGTLSLFFKYLKDKNIIEVPPHDPTLYSTLRGPDVDAYCSLPFMSVNQDVSNQLKDRPLLQTFFDCFEDRVDPQKLFNLFDKLT